eukprot:COSAG02_NODE_7226_length_3110_cov_1.828296_3_plen_165_part_00
MWLRHGFHSGTFDASDHEKLDFMVYFAQNCSRLGVPLHAITHHEYIEVEQYSTTPPSASLLDNTATIAQQVRSRLQSAAPGIQIWAGEIGPHNGRSPGCDHTSLRWANWADSFWYDRNCFMPCLTYSNNYVVRRCFHSSQVFGCDGIESRPWLQSILSPRFRWH